jgi:hypothetical protein
MPYQSKAVSAWNIAAKILPFKALSPHLSLEGIIPEAIKTAGHPDFGSTDILDGLTNLLEALEKTADLHPFGKFYTKKVITGLLVNRLKLNKLWQQHPEILGEKIETPLIILGLPRTGTSLLVNLLSKDPQHRYLTNWETTVSQVPPAGNYSFAHDPRRKQGQFLMKFQDYLAPQMQNIHEFHLDGPEECTPLLMQSFTTKAFGEMYEVPAYGKWLDNASHKETYRHHKRILQTLQWKYPGTRWLLKCPLHMEAIHDLIETYPDACVAQTHRDPVKVIPSHASLCATFHGISKASLEPDKLGEYVMASWAGYLTKYLNQRRALDQSRFIDIQYASLRHDPFKVVERIYEQFGFPLSMNAASSMRAYLAQQQSRKITHIYTAQDYGLTPARIRDSFKDYIEQFNIPLEE